jgi:hypothetical protein
MSEEQTISNIYGYGVRSENRLDLMRIAVAIFATLERVRTGKVKIRRKLEDVLAFYALNGYNPETKRMIIETLGISADNLTQINAELTRNGYLIRDKNNFRKKYLHPDILRLKDTLTSPIIGARKAILVRFEE